MSSHPAGAPRLRLTAVPAGVLAPDARRALEQAVHFAVRAPSLHDTRLWRFEIEPDRLVIRTDRAQQLSTLDPIGRELVQSVGAAVFNARVALAARGWAAETDRLPVRDDPEALAVLRPVPGSPDAGLAALAPAVHRQRTNRRRLPGGHVPDDVVRRLIEITEREGVSFVPVVHESQRRLVARLTLQADRLQNAADPVSRAELRTWTARVRGERGGVPLVDDGPTMALLATRTDDPLAWLRAGEALQHVLLELTRLGWVAEPLTQAVEVPFTRVQLRAALTWDAHPQLLLRIGRAQATVPASRRRAGGVPVETPRATGTLPVQRPPAPTDPPDHPVR